MLESERSRPIRSTAHPSSASLAEFTIPKPTAYECVAVTVTDDAGNPLPRVSLLRDGEFQSGLTDANGTIRIKVEPGVTYEFGAFIKNAGWPCPAIDPRTAPSSLRHTSHRVRRGPARR